jgi:hypothetical protein
MSFLPNPRGRQPVRQPWPHDRLVRERAIALGHTIDLSTLRSYTSALTSYLTFVRAHNLPVEPTEDTLSFFTVYMSHHISPRSVGCYLSGIIQQLEPFFPDARVRRNSTLVQRTLAGCMKLLSQPIRRKHPLATSDLDTVIAHYYLSAPSHDDLLFIAQLLTGFFALLRLGEMVFPDSDAIRDWRKISRRHTVHLAETSYDFVLPYHKADRFFAGNQVLVTKGTGDINPVSHFAAYLRSRDALLPLHSALWLRSDGSVPTRAWFLRRLGLFFGSEIRGQSMRAGGATYLAEKGTAPSLIQARGRWSSDAFLIYVRKNPALLIDLIATP